MVVPLPLAIIALIAPGPRDDHLERMTGLRNENDYVIPLPNAAENLRTVGLSAGDQASIINQVEKTSFDSGYDATSELLAKRVKIGRLHLLIVRGSNVLCGGTGNCQTWLFYKRGCRWTSLIEGAPPIVATLRFRLNADHYQLFGCRNVAADASQCTHWRLNHGKFRTR